MIINQGKTSIGIEANLAALLSYLFGFVTGIIFYLLERKNRFVRFNAMQSILVFTPFFILNVILNFLPIIGLMLSAVIGVVAIILWVVLMIKSYQGVYLKIPIAGDIAEKNS